MTRLKAVKIGGFALASLILTSVVAQFTGACPGLINEAPTIATAVVTATGAYLMRKPLTNAGLKAIATGTVGAAGAALVQRVTEVCGTDFVRQIPTLVTVGACVAIGHYLQAPHQSAAPPTPPSA